VNQQSINVLHPAPRVSLQSNLNIALSPAATSS
jgi:hypothetical protein